MTDYEELVQEYGFIDTMESQNSDSEFVMISIDENCASIRTLQKNGWMRINVYYPDGVSEEYFEH